MRLHLIVRPKKDRSEGPRDGGTAAPGPGRLSYAEAEAQYYEGVRLIDSGDWDEAFRVFDRLASIDQPELAAVTDAADVARGIFDTSLPMDLRAKRALALFTPTVKRVSIEDQLG